VRHSLAVLPNRRRAREKQDSANGHDGGVRARRSGSFAIRVALTLLLVLAGVAGLPRSALAASGSFALVWTSSETCVSPADLEAAVLTRLGRDPFVAIDRADVVLDGRELPATSGKPRAVLEQRDRAGHVLGSRELAAASCEELKRAAAFVIVLIVDPDALLHDPATEPPKTTEPPPSRQRPRHADVAPPAPRRPRPHARSLVLAGAGITYGAGLLPGGDFGGAVMLGFTPWTAPVRFEWRGGYRRSLEAPRRREFAVLAQEWRTCFLVRPLLALAGSACAGGVWTAIYPGTSGLTDGDQAPKTDLSPELALGSTLQIGSFGLAFDVSALFPRRRYAFSYLDNAGHPQPLHEVGRIVVAATIGVTRAF
jgi:hypothetical protein